MRIAKILLHSVIGLVTAINLLSPGLFFMGAQTADAATLGAPSTIGYQGRLKSASSGSTVSNGTYYFRFYLYDASTGGTQVTSDTATLTVTNGYFSTNIDLSTDVVDFVNNLWMEIGVSSDGLTYDTMTTRVKLNSSAYSFVTRSIENSASAPATDLFSGRMYFNTTTGKLNVYNGTAWVGVSNNLDDAYNNFGAAASKITIDASESQTGGLEFELSATNNPNLVIDTQGTGDFVIQDAGSTWAQFTDGQAFDVNGTGAISLDADAASNFNTSVGDLTFEAEIGSLILKGDEAVADAIYLDANDAAGTGITMVTGVTAGYSLSGGPFNVSSTGILNLYGGGAATFGTTVGDVTLSADSGSLIFHGDENVADAIQVVAAAGGIDISASGASAGEDIDITATGSSINLTSTEADSAAIRLDADATTGSGIQIDAYDATNNTSGVVQVDGGTVQINTNSSTGLDLNVLGSGNANIDTTDGDISLTAGGSSGDVSITSSQGDVTINTNTNTKTINIGTTNYNRTVNLSTGTGNDTLNLARVATGSKTINIGNTSGSTTIDIESGTGGVDMDLTATGAFAIDGDLVVIGNAGVDGDVADGDNDLLVAGVLEVDGEFELDGSLDADVTTFDVDASDLISLTSTKNNAQAIYLEATAGGIDIAATGAAAGEDIDITSTGSSINISATEADANAITVFANAEGGAIVVRAGDTADASTADGNDVYVGAEDDILIDANDDMVLTISDDFSLTTLDLILTGTNTTDINATNEAITIDATDTDADGGGTITLTGNDGVAAIATTGNVAFTATAADITNTAGGEFDATSTGLMDLNAGANLDIDVTGSYDMLATTTFSIDGTGASNVSATSGNLTLSTITAGDLLMSSVAAMDLQATTGLTLDSAGATAISIGSDNNTGTINIGQGNAGRTINIATDNTVADTITIGSALDSLSLTEDTWSITTAGAATLPGALSAGTTAGVDIVLGNSTGNFAVTSDNADFTLADATDNVFQLVNATNAHTYLDIDAGAADTVTLGNATDITSILGSTTSSIGLGTAFTVAATTGLTTIAGAADGTDALVLTLGDILVTDGDLDLSGGDFNVNLDDGDSVNIDGDGSPTADRLVVGTGDTSVTDGVDTLFITTNVSSASGSAIRIDPDFTTSVVDGIRVIDIDNFAATTTADVAASVRGLMIGDLTQTENTPGNISSQAIKIGSGWDVGILLPDDIGVTFGLNADITIAYDETTDDAFEMDGALVVIGDDPGGSTATGDGDLLVQDDLEVDGKVDVDLVDGDQVAVQDDGSGTTDLMTITGDSSLTGVDALYLSMTAADGADALNSGLKVDIASEGTAAGDAGAGILLNLTSVANVASTNVAIEIDATNEWDFDLLFGSTSPVIGVANGGVIGFIDTASNSLLTITDGGTNVTVSPGEAGTGIFGTTALEWDGMYVGDDGVGVTFGADQDAKITWQAANAALELDGALVVIGTDPTGSTATGDGDLLVQDALEVDGAANIADTTVGADVAMGNIEGNLTFLSDNADFGLKDATDNVFQLVNATNARTYLDIDAGATDTVTLGNATDITSILGSTTSSIGLGTAFTVAATTGLTTIAGAADGTDALVLTLGDILVTNGDLDVAGGDFNVTLDAGDDANITKTATAAATEEGLEIDFNAGAGDGTDIYRAFVIDAASANHAATTDQLVGIAIDTLASADAEGVEIAFSIGDSWDQDIRFDSATPYIVMNNGGTLVLEDSLGNDILSLADVSEAANHILTGDADTGLVLSGMTTDLSTGTNENLTIAPNGSGDFIVEIDSNSVASFISTGAPAEDMVTIGNSANDSVTDGVDALVIDMDIADNTSGNLVHLTPSFVDDNADGTADDDWNVITIDNFTAQLAADGGGTFANSVRGLNIGVLTESVGGDEAIISSAIKIENGWDRAIEIGAYTDGVDAIKVTSGDIVLLDGDLDLSGGDFNVALDAADSASIANSGSTGFAAALSVANTTAASDTAGSEGLGIALTITNYADDGAADTHSGLNVAVTSNASDAGTDDIVYGIRVQNLGGAADSGAEYAIYQAGTTWDYGIYAEDQSKIITSAENGYALEIAPTLSDDADGTDQVAGLTITATDSSDDGSDTLWGVNVADIGANTSTTIGMRIGGGWDDAIRVNASNFVVETTGAVDITDGTSEDIMQISASNTGFAQEILTLDTAEEQTGTFFFINAISDTDGTPDVEFSVDQAGTVRGDGGAYATPADFAEFFYDASGTLSAGEVVSVDLVNANAVTRSTIARDPHVMGVVSTKAAFVGNWSEEKEAGTNWEIVGLAGQVPVKVTNENGAIAIGDYLTSSSAAGYAMKADAGDPTIGIALETFSGSEGMIQTLISRNNGSLQSGDTGEALAAGALDSETLTVTGDASFGGSVTVAEHLYGSKDMAGRARMAAGHDYVHVAFTQAYEDTPVITFSSRSDAEAMAGYQYWVGDESATGFTIYASGWNDQVREFSWIAMGVVDGVVTISDGTTSGFDGEVTVTAPVVEEPAPVEEPVVEEPVVEETAPVEEVVTEEPAPVEEPVVEEPVVEEPAPEAPAEVIE